MSSPNLKIDSPERLRSAILQLQQDQLLEGGVLKKQFTLTFESLKPLNLIKGALGDIAQSMGISSFLAHNKSADAGDDEPASLTAQPPPSSVKTIVGSLVLLGISGAVAKNSLLLKSLGRGLAHLLRSRQAKKLKALPEHISS
ncbi:hypothetical protein RT717_13995 [Imperialibacter roseus]|uniref:Uncharacterized protein n=1 Tax=Imperialibacter roseus TaxID=1324217 RepID=A0ABZ0IGQ4_9BACT|nr:hypothetical protein [Imperialibacter roseus]WOK04187.1 hypothetical protein RT717_13995 [Imperialibacter roseus]